LGLHASGAGQQIAINVVHESLVTVER